MWRISASISLFALAARLSWTSSKALGSHLRVDAALGSEHELVRSGPYGIVRNPDLHFHALCVVRYGRCYFAMAVIFGEPDFVCGRH